MSKLLTDTETHYTAAPFDVTLTHRPDAARLAQWDSLVESTPGSDVSQLSRWADVRQAASFEPLYMFVTDGTDLVGGALILTRRLPLLGTVGYVPYGPVVTPHAEQAHLAATLATALRQLVADRLRLLLVQPPLGADAMSSELRNNGFRPSDAGIAPAASLLLDLTRDEDALHAGLKAEYRKKSRRWSKYGVRVRRGTENDLALLAQLHADTARHQGFAPLPLDYITTLYRELAPVGHAVLFIGEVDGRPVCAKLLTGCGGVLKGRLTGTDRELSKSKLGVPIAVIWEAVRWAKANGYNGFDFGGIRESVVATLQESQPDLAQLTGSELFKVGFGARPFRYPMAVEMFRSPLIRTAYDASRRWPAGRRFVERASHSLRAGRLLRS